MKLIIAGSRDATSSQALYEKLDRMLANVEITEIVSGTARGADRIGEKYAALRSVPVKKFPADWDTYGKSAGYRRNEQMAEYADALLALWDGKSRGTAHMITQMKTRKKPVRVIDYRRFT